MPDLPPLSGPSNEAAQRTARIYAALVVALGRSDTLLTDLAGCEDATEANRMLQAQLDIDEESADEVLSMQLRLFPRAAQARLRTAADDRARAAGTPPESS